MSFLCLPLVCISVTSHTNVPQGIAGLCNAEKWIECRTIRPFSDAACHVTVTWCTSRCIIVHQILLPFANVFQDVRICLGICFCIVFVICICVSDAPDASLFMRYCCTPQSFSGHSYFPRHNSCHYFSYKCTGISCTINYYFQIISKLCDFVDEIEFELLGRNSARLSQAKSSACVRLN